MLRQATGKQGLMPVIIDAFVVVVFAAVALSFFSIPHWFAAINIVCGSSIYQKSGLKNFYFNTIEMENLSLNTFTSLQTTKRLSCKQYDSKTLDKRQCSLIYACKPVIP